MHGSKKILTITSMMLLVFALVVIVIVSINFRDFSQEQEIQKAKNVAYLVRDGLTAHMVNGTMDQRELFLDNAKDSSSALKVWIFRSQKVIEQYGKGYNNEVTKDAIDNQVIQTGKAEQVIDETLNKATLRITIPYIATTENKPNCLECHTNSQEGDVLGGITMVFSMDDIRTNAVITLIKILGITMVAILIFIYITSGLLKPYTSALVFIKESLKKANSGDYSARIDTKKDDESTEVSQWLNTLLAKLENTVGAIEKNISLFVADRRKKYNDPLEKSQDVINDLAMIYRFKKTIEQDKSKDIIYHRLIKIFKEQLHVADLSFYEVDIKNDKRILIYDDTPDKFCEIADCNTSEHCRAYRTKSIVISDEFEDICQACDTPKEYLCINYPIDDNISLVLNIKPDNKDELHENKKAIGYIRNYLESARPVLQSKILTDILQKSNMIDGLTGLYNRKYLDKFMDTNTKQYASFAIAMVDIDYFKKVNDTYGHDAGDMILKGLSELLLKLLKSDDIAFRFGGEEFLIFIPQVKSAHELMESIRLVFEGTSFNVGGQNINKTLSSGISYYPADATSVWQVIKCADLALYEAKNTGRNRVIEYHKINEDEEAQES
jgi:diguanylate cyclase (GGDEF)-like protein